MLLPLPSDLIRKRSHLTQEARLCDALGQIRNLKCKQIDGLSEEQLVRLTVALQKTRIDQVIRETMVNGLTTSGRYGGLMQIVVGKKGEDQYPWAEMWTSRLKPDRVKRGMETIGITLVFADASKIRRDPTTGEITNILEALEPLGHETLVLIDHKSKTIEYFDPHGIAKWNLEVWPVVARELGKTHVGYEFVPPWETCPMEGMQAIYDVGLCAEFSTLYEFLRFRCPQVSAFNLQVYLVSIGEAGIKQLIHGWLCFKMNISLSTRDTATREQALREAKT